MQPDPAAYPAAVARDKTIARRLSAAGCVRALGIVRVRHGVDDTRVLRPDERAMAWRIRASQPGLGNAFLNHSATAGTPPGAVHTLPEGAQASGNLMPACARKHSTPVECAQAGFPLDKRELPDMTPEQWERWESEMLGPI